MSELVPAESAGQETAPAAPADPEQLRAEIERTRENLGETVEQLAAKMDVKSRARAEAAQLMNRVRQRGTRARQAAPDRARQVAAQATGRAKQAGIQARQAAPGYVAQVTGRAKQAGNQAGQTVPDRARQVATQGAKVTREQRVPLALAGGSLAAALLAVFLFRQRNKLAPTP